MNAKQINKKYTGKYVDISKQFDYEKQDWNYGNKEQFEKRHFEIVIRIQRALEEF